MLLDLPDGRVQQPALQSAILVGQKHETVIRFQPHNTVPDFGLSRRPVHQSRHNDSKARITQPSELVKGLGGRRQRCQAPSQFGILGRSERPGGIGAPAENIERHLGEFGRRLA